MVLSSADIFFQNRFFFLIFFPVIPVECQAVLIQTIGLNCLQRLSAGDTSKQRVYDDNSSKLDEEHQIFACLRYFADKLCQQLKPSSG